jgi:hypothetical protein
MPFQIPLFPSYFCVDAYENVPVIISSCPFLIFRWTKLNIRC